MAGFIVGYSGGYQKLEGQTGCSPSSGSGSPDWGKIAILGGLALLGYWLWKQGKEGAGGERLQGLSGFALPAKIPPELEPLAEEARKYKTAEEFKANLWQKYTKPFGKRPEDINEPAGTYLSRFHETTIEGEPVKIAVFNAKKPYYIPFHNEVGEYWKDVLSKRFSGKRGEELTQALKEQGYDAVFAVSKYGGKDAVVEAVALNRKAVRFFKHLGKDITDFYNLATKGVKRGAK